MIAGLCFIIYLLQKKMLYVNIMIVLRYSTSLSVPDWKVGMKDTRYLPDSLIGSVASLYNFLPKIPCGMCLPTQH